MKRNALLIVALLIGLTMLAFNSTKLKFSWMNPHYTGTLQFKNIMVLAINGRASIRAEFEDQLCAGLAHP
jgi:hypothetical protein